MKTGNTTIALAQLPVEKGAVAENLAIHLTYIQHAARLRADVMVFPELSLTGYELELLEQLAMPQSAEIFSTLSAAAVAHNIVVIAGCPLVNENSKPHIGAVICFPNGEREFYAKQYLHEGEDVYCSVGAESYLFTVNGTRIALAICADFANPTHAEMAVDQQADVYIASALISETGYLADANLLASIAKHHQFPVLLANHISNTGGWQTCGKSGGWSVDGELTIAANGTEPSLVLCRIHQRTLNGRVEDVEPCLDDPACWVFLTTIAAVRSMSKDAHLHRLCAPIAPGIIKASTAADLSHSVRLGTRLKRIYCRQQPANIL